MPLAVWMQKFRTVDYYGLLFNRLAFLARYGHQSVLGFFPGGITSAELRSLNLAVSDLIRGESDATQEAASSGGG